jgi:enterochelin esterase-like enzyme
LLYGAPGATGNDRITPHYLENSPLEMAQNNPADQLISVKWFIACGKQEQLRAVNQELDEIWNQRSIEHVYLSIPGRHDWKLWRKAIYPGLQWISEDFRKP